MNGRLARAARRPRRRRSRTAIALGAGRRRAARAPSGTSTRRKPSRAASRTRSVERARTRRTSPPSPISPHAATSAGSGRSSRLDASASATRGRRRLGDAHAARHVHVDVAPEQVDAARAGRAPRAAARGARRRRRCGAPRGAVARRRDQRLDLDQHRPRALERAARRTSPARRRAARRGTARSGSRRASSPRSPIVEDADLCVEPKRFLLRAQQAERVAAVALEGEHHVDQVLEHARPGERALLGDVTDEDERRAARLRGGREQRRALAHLRDRARRRLDALGAQRLDRVDQHERGRELAPRLGERLDARLGQHEEPARAPPAGARRAAAPARGSPRRSRRGRARAPRGPPRAGARACDLPTPGSPPSSTTRARHEAAAEHAVELGDAGREARRGGGVDLAQRRGLRGRRRPGLDAQQVAPRARRRAGRGLLDERRPARRTRAAPEPARLLRAALGAGVDATWRGPSARAVLPESGREPRTAVDRRLRRRLTAAAAGLPRLGASPNRRSPCSTATPASPSAPCATSPRARTKRSGSSTATDVDAAAAAARRLRPARAPLRPQGDGARAQQRAERALPRGLRLLLAVARLERRDPQVPDEERRRDPRRAPSAPRAPAPRATAWCSRAAARRSSARAGSPS